MHTVEFEGLCNWPVVGWGEFTHGKYLVLPYH